jgi:hypothetical protein
MLFALVIVFLAIVGLQPHFGLVIFGLCRRLRFSPGAFDGCFGLVVCALDTRVMFFGLFLVLSLADRRHAGEHDHQSEDVVQFS